MDKIKAIEYLIENSVYGDEWTGTGMWEAVCELFKYKDKITEEYLKKLLKKAEGR